MLSAQSKIVPVILSGGSGTRLWPLSRDNYPKQFIQMLASQPPIIQETMRRVMDAACFYPPLMVGNEMHRFLLAEHMLACGIETPQILLEPSAHNTAPAIIAAALYVRQSYGNCLMLVLPTDHMISDSDAFLKNVLSAAKVAAQNYIVTFGIQPNYAETGYGYIQRGAQINQFDDAFHIARFVEKPDAETATSLLTSGDYLWNSGMLLFSPELLLNEMQRLQPKLMDICRQAFVNRQKDMGFIRLDKNTYARAENLSIDNALLELTGRAAMVPFTSGWSDTGAWDLLWGVSPHDTDGNSTQGECYASGSRNCYLRSENGPAIAALNVNNLAVVATKDVVLVCDKDQAQSLKPLVAQVRAANPQLAGENLKAHRPWGAYERIDRGNRFQVKRLTVKPGQKLSLQMHQHRSEHWIVVQGTARMTCDNLTKIVPENGSFYVPCGSIHRIENVGKIDLEIIEVQTGSYLGEDDIVRFEDGYGRAEVNA